ncbi:MAG: TrkH family potassium uptake protein [Butyrivibrio sp.]|nr:TrkH family potassium uptake protein [Butyrivibrio sp.]
MKGKAKTRRHLTQTQFIVYGFIAIILIGALLLCTPIASRTHTATPFLDSLFTAVSSTCVTGLVVVDTYVHWSLFGQIVILFLIQIGGLGFITIGVLFSLILRRKIGLKTRGLMQESVNTIKIGGIIRLARKIIRGTLLIEGAGAILLSIRFSFDFGVPKGIYYGIFHSISAFCNAGFDLMGVNGEFNSLCDYAGDPWVNIVIMSLIVIGGIGFVVWDDISINKFKFKKYSFHTKIVLVTTLFLIVSSSTLFYIVEYDNTMEGMNVGERILASMFSAITARTAGFNTIDTGSLKGASLLLTCILMFIGGSPGSTAGGIKTTTFFVLMVNLFANMRGGKSGIFRRRFEDGAVKKASMVFILNLVLCMVAMFVILAITNLAFSDIMFEVFSAMGTAGMSTGVTRDLNEGARCIIMLLMFCGRVGSLSFALSFLQKKKVPPVCYPQEKISIG